MSTIADDQLLDAVDNHDSPQGVVRRRDVFRLGVNFRVAHLLIFNDREELLLQQLSEARERHPLQWGSSVAAYVQSGEDYSQALSRRAAEELGITNLRMQGLGKIALADNGCTKFVGIFAATHNGPFTLDREHIRAVAFVPVHDLMHWPDNNRPLTPTFRQVLAFYRSAHRE